jgi:hypothetical protein
MELFEDYGLPESPKTYLESQLESIRRCGSQDMAYGSRLSDLLEKNEK